MNRLPIALILAAALFASCASKPAVVTDDMTFEQITQRAQEASDRYDYQAALDYYGKGLELFSSDLSKVAACTYEIAFIHYKRGAYQLSADKFKTLFAMYEQYGAEHPQRYLILARKVYPNVEAKLAEPKTE